MLNFLKTRKAQIIKLSIMLFVLIAISVASMLILQSFGIIYYNEDGMQINMEIFDSFRSSWYSWLILLSLQVIVTTLLCFIPGASMAFILLIQAFCTYAWQAFLVSFIGVLCSSIIMYLTGRFGGYKICEKILGKEDCKKASELLCHKGAVYFPLMMMFPIFPDDALVMIAGTIRISMKWFVPSIVVGRGIGIATIVFGISLIPYDKFTSPWHWILFVLVCAVLIVAVFYIAYRLNKKLENRANHKNQQ